MANATLSSADSFTFADGVDLASHNSDQGGATWSHNTTLDGGNIGTIVSNGFGGIRPAISTSFGIVSYMNSVAPISPTFDVVVDLVIASLSTNGYFRIVTNCGTNSNTGYEFFVIQSPGTNNATWYIIKRINGVETILATQAATLANCRVKVSIAPGSQGLYTSTNNGATFTQVVAPTADSDVNIPAYGNVGICLGAGASANLISDTVGLHADNFTVINDPGTWAPNTTGVVTSVGNQNFSGNTVSAQITQSTSGGNTVSAQITQSTSGGNTVFAQITQSASGYKFNFAGTSLALSYDSTTWTAGTKPSVIFSIDGGVWNTSTGAISGSSRILSSGLAYGIHTAEIRFDFGPADESDTWTPADVLKIIGFTLDAGGFISAPTGNATARPKMAMMFGDSITRGYAAQSITGTFTSLNSFPVILAHALNAELGVVASSGSGWTKGGSDAHTPAFPSSFGYYFNGAARSWPATLDFLMVFLGTNDGLSTKAAIALAVTNWIVAARTIYPATTGTKIVIGAPPDAAVMTLDAFSIQSALQLGVTNYLSIRGGDSLVFFVDPSTRNYGFANSGGHSSPYSQYSWDGLHPTTEGHALLAADYASLIQSAVGAASASAATTVTTSTGNARRSGRQVTRSTGNSRARGSQVSLSTGNAMIGN